MPATKMSIEDLMASAEKAEVSANELTEEAGRARAKVVRRIREGKESTGHPMKDFAVVQGGGKSFPELENWGSELFEKVSANKGQLVLFVRTTPVEHGHFNIPYDKVEFQLGVVSGDLAPSEDFSCLTLPCKKYVEYIDYSCQAETESKRPVTISVTDISSVVGDPKPSSVSEALRFCRPLPKFEVFVGDEEVITRLSSGEFQRLLSVSSLCIGLFKIGRTDVVKRHPKYMDVLNVWIDDAKKRWEKVKRVESNELSKTIQLEGGVLGVSEEVLADILR